MTPDHPTRARLQDAALLLFRERGYDAASVADIARAVGVSHMTFFRHFPTKESVVVEDLFDPMIAAGVAQQPGSLPALHRAVLGVVAALNSDAARAELASAGFRERMELIAATPSLRGAAWASTRMTQDAITAALAGDSTHSDAAAAAGAVIGAATAILLAWTDAPAPGHPADALRAGLLSLLDRP